LEDILMSEKLPYRSFTTAFKEAAVLRISKGDNVMPLARELGVPRKLLYNWHKAWKAEGVAGLNRKRGRGPGAKLAGKASEVALKTDASALSKAQNRIAELERLVGRQQVDLDFFRKALRALNGQEAQGNIVPASSRSSKP
jgi:transposase